MSIASNAVCEVQGGVGSDNNGGGWVPGSSGVDYSQQSSPQYALTGLTSSGAGATILTASAAADMVGNFINITGGTNFITGCKQITSVVAGVSITCDSNVTTGAGAAGTANIGGCLNSLAPLVSLLTNGGIVYVKASASYTLTATLTFSGMGSGKSLSIIGYTTTRGDNGRATITTATNSTNLIGLTSNTGAINFLNIKFTNTATTRAIGISNTSGTWQGSMISNCIFDGLSRGLDMRSCNQLLIHKCEFKNCTSAGVRVGSANASCSFVLSESWIHGNTGNGLETQGDGVFTIINSAIVSNTSNGWLVTTGDTFQQLLAIFNSAFCANTSAGIATSGTAPMGLKAQNCVFQGNGSYGINFAGAPLYAVFRTNAFGGNNGGGTGLDITSSTLTLAGDEVTLTGDPFTNKSSGDFSLNSTAGAGAALKQAGTPTSIP